MCLILHLLWTKRLHFEQLSAALPGPCFGAFVEQTGHVSECFEVAVDEDGGVDDLVSVDERVERLP